MLLMTLTRRHSRNHKHENLWGGKELEVGKIANCQCLKGMRNGIVDGSEVKRQFFVLFCFKMGGITACLLIGGNGPGQSGEWLV